MQFGTTEPKAKRIWGLLLLGYLFGLIFFLVFKNVLFNMPNRINPSLPEILHTKSIEGLRYNLEPFSTIKLFWEVGTNSIMQRIAIYNIVGNIVVFVPLGILYPLYKRSRYFINTVWLGLLTTLVVEVIQLVTGLGVFDIDDIILNFLGSMLGLLIFTVVRPRYPIT